MNELEQRKQELLAEIANLDNLRIERDEILKQITQKSSILAELMGDVANLKQEVEVLKSQKAIQLAAQDVELQNKIAHVEEIAVTLNKERTALDERENDLVKRAQTLNEQESSISTKKEELLLLEARTNMNNGILNDRETKIHDQEVGIELIRKETTLKVALLDEREAELVRKSEELTQRKEGLDKFDVELQERNKQVYITAAQRDASDKEINARRAELVLKEKEISDKFSEIADEIKAVELERNNLSTMAQDLESRQKSIEFKELELKVKEKELKQKEKELTLKAQL